MQRVALELHTDSLDIPVSYLSPFIVVYACIFQTRAALGYLYMERSVGGGLLLRVNLLKMTDFEMHLLSAPVHVSHPLLSPPAQPPPAYDAGDPPPAYSGNQALPPVSTQPVTARKTQVVSVGEHTFCGAMSCCCESSSSSFVRGRDAVKRSFVDSVVIDLSWRWGFYFVCAGVQAGHGGCPLLSRLC